MGGVSAKDLQRALGQQKHRNGGFGSGDDLTLGNDLPVATTIILILRFAFLLNPSGFRNNQMVN